MSLLVVQTLHILMTLINFFGHYHDSKLFDKGSILRPPRGPKILG
jgi:hypothetical protein